MVEPLLTLTYFFPTTSQAEKFYEAVEKAGIFSELSLTYYERSVRVYSTIVPLPTIEEEIARILKIQAYMKENS